MTILYGIVAIVLGLALTVFLGLVLYKEKEPKKAPEELTLFSKPRDA